MPGTRPPLWLLAVLALSPGPALAQHSVVTAPEVLKLQNGKPPAVVVDTRTAEEFRLGRVPGAVNLPPEEVIREASKLPKDKRTPLVFYCRGPG